MINRAESMLVRIRVCWIGACFEILETCLTWVRCDKSGRVDLSENTSVVDRSVFRFAGDVFLIGRDVEMERIDGEVTYLGIFVLISREAEDE